MLCQGDVLMRSHCKRGHSLEGENVITYQAREGRTVRTCRTCTRARTREWKRAHYAPTERTPKQTKALVDRILANVRRNECWEWQGATTNGYGIVQRGRRGEGTVRVHRAIYEHFVGQIPDGLDVMHRCHNRRCVNPSHLAIGTRAENMRMSQRDGRLLRRRLARAK
jgi:hypothetical protein